MDELIKTWDGETVITRYDSDTGTWMFLAIHSTALGIATGGTQAKKLPESPRSSPRCHEARRRNDL